MRLSQVIDELVEERGLKRDVLNAIVVEGLTSAYTKKYPHVSFAIEYSKQTDELHVFAHKTVVSSVEDADTQISLRKARAVQDDIELGATIKVPFEGSIGRIEILRAKQVIAQQIRAIETAALYEEFKGKEGTIVTGAIYKTEPRGVLVKIGEALAFLPKSLMISGDTYTPGYTIRALLKEVLPEPRNDNQLILDRASPQFLVELLRIEIPEIYENIVEIKKAVRIAGYKSKIIVISHDKNVDPVGTCIGFGGARIKPILRELGTEKIDIIGESFSTDDFVRSALKPAVVRRVEIVDNGSVAHVWLDADQRSLAIGKMGQNIALASELCGFHIRLMDDASAVYPTETTRESAESTVDENTASDEEE